jgi:P27 family predicted phage terminase small subunit
MAGNASSGRPRKPTAKLRLLGAEREDRHGKRIDEKRFSSDVEKPSGLSELESRCWDEITPELFAVGVVKRTDSATLRGMVEWLARYRTCCLWLRKRQTVDSFDGDSEQVVLIARIQRMANNAWAAFVNSAARFGMTPSDRARLEMGDEKPADDFDEDLKKHA